MCQRPYPWFAFYFSLSLPIPPVSSQAAAFLAGEPYVMDYLASMDSDVQASARSRGWRLTEEEVLQGHVKAWRLERSTAFVAPPRRPSPKPPRNPHLFNPENLDPSLDWGI